VTSVSSASAARIIEAKKASGFVIMADTTAANIACDGEVYTDSDWIKAAALVTRPPIRVGQAEEVFLMSFNIIICDF